MYAICLHEAPFTFVCLQMIQYAEMCVRRIDPWHHLNLYIYICMHACMHIENIFAHKDRAHTAHLRAHGHGNLIADFAAVNATDKL